MQRAWHATQPALRVPPKVGDQVAWAGRINKGMDALYDSGINGIAGSGMIARGGCADCSDDEIRLAVDFMVDGSR